MPSSLRVVVTGMVGLYPVGGVAWDYLQYVIGLARMGHDVYYHEDTWSWPYHPLKRTYTAEGDYSAAFLGDFFRSYAPELDGRWHYLHLHETSYGMERKAFDQVARTADIFLNVSGACMIPEELSPGCIKVFLDTDPGYNQIMLSERFDWSEFVERWCASVLAHDQHFTYAENIHGDDCLIPKLGLRWKTTRMPVVLDLWGSLSPRRPADSAPWSTVMTWNAFKGRLVYRGVEYKSKDQEFERLMDMPRRLDVPLKVAVGGVNAPLTRLAQAGWQVVDGPEATITPRDYQEFIASSRGEISPAKHVYVAMRSGWFSCRSACYLASARPVVVQDTGFSPYIPPGPGLLAFTNLDEAIEAIREVEADYDAHAEGALEAAREHFHYERVLQRLIDDLCCD